MTKRMKRMVVPLNCIAISNARGNLKSEGSCISNPISQFFVFLQSLNCALLPPSDPDSDARSDDAYGQQQNQHVIHEPALCFCHRNAAIVRVLGSDGNEVLVLRQPGYGIEKKIAVTLQSESAVGSKSGISINDQATLLVLTLGFGGNDS